MILFATLATIVSAQTDDKGYKEGAWVLKGVTGINMSQTAMTNWSAGGENSIAGNAYLNGSLTHKSGNWLWVTNLVLDYGLSKTKSQGMRKSSDKIGLSTQLGYAATKVWYYTLMADLNTQFAKGYNYPDKSHYISNFFAPAYSNVALGMEYRPKSNYSIFLSPVSTKMTFVSDDYLSDLGSFGVAPAILIYQYGMTDLGLLGKLIASIFTICGAMRLARFNVNVGEVKGYFQGMPIPAGACVLATYVLSGYSFSTYFVAILTFVIGCIMYSNVKFPDFKGKGNPMFLPPVIVAAAVGIYLIYVNLSAWPFAAMFTYSLAGIINCVYAKMLNKQ